MARKREHMIAGLDIGTSKVVAIVGKVDPDTRHVEVVGCGRSPSHGLRRGVVMNIEATVSAINRAVDEAQLMSGYDIDAVWAGIAGEHIRGEASHGMVSLQKNRQVTDMDIQRARDTATSIERPENQRVLHDLPQSYSIDRMYGVKQPRGMIGERLEVFSYLVSCSNNASRNIENCIESCNMRMRGLVLESLASSHAVLLEDEKELGVNLVDIGGGTTDIASFVDGSLCHVGVIPIAGDQVTRDIAMVFRIPRHQAERLKLRSGHVIPTQAGDERLTIDCVAEGEAETLTRRMLAEVLGARYEELFLGIRDRIQKVEGQLPGASVVLTGGGSLIEGVRTLAEDIFESSVRIGVPHNISGLEDEVQSPLYSTAVGLLKYAAGQEQMLRNSSNQGRPSWDRLQSLLQRLLGRKSLPSYAIRDVA